MKIRLSLLFCVAALSLPSLRANDQERFSPSAEQRLQEMDLSLALRQYERVQMELFETSLKLDLLPVDGDATDKFRDQQSKSLQKRLQILQARADGLREAALKASTAMAAADTSVGTSIEASRGSAEIEEDDMESDDRDDPCGGGSDLESTLPDGAKVVAGGLFIQWRAPENGTAILVEACSGRAVKSQSLARDDEFKLDPSDSDTVHILNAMFADADDVKDEDRLAPLPKNSRFVLYFAARQEQ